MERRGGAENQTAHGAEQYREGEREGIDFGGKENWECADHWGDAQGGGSPNGEGCSETCSEEGEEHIFREHQADDAPASRAECHAHGHLALPCAAPSEHK